MVRAAPHRKTRNFSVLVLPGRPTERKRQPHSVADPHFAIGVKEVHLYGSLADSEWAGHYLDQLLYGHLEAYYFIFLRGFR